MITPRTETIFRLFILILLFNMKYTMLYARIYDLNDNAHGLRIAGNEKFIVGAFNAYQIYSLHLVSEPITSECIIHYTHSDLYVYSLATINLPDITADYNELVSFVQIAENMTTSSESLISVVLSIIVVNTSAVACENENTIVEIIDTVIWNDQVHQEYMLLKVDPRQKYVYVFTDAAVFSYELITKKIDQFIFMNDSTFWHNLTQISVRSFDITNEWALVAGYARILTDIRSYYYILLVELHPLRLVSSEIFYDFSADTSETLVYNLYYDLSVAIAPNGFLVAIGAANLNSITLCEIIRLSTNENGSDWTLNLNRDAIIVTLSSGNTGFGRGVSWLDDQNTNSLCILVDTAKQQVWSTSQIRVYPNISISTKIINGVPDFVFPNSQQQILDGFSTEKLVILQLLSVANNLLLLFDDSYIFYIPSAGIGLCSVMMNADGMMYNQVFEPQTCVGGTFKNKSSPGPCNPCPTQTKSVLDNKNNNDAIALTKCMPCKPESFCPFGSNGEVNLSDVQSYTQTFTYPNAAGVDNYDDLLLNNFFFFKVTDARCLLVSPLFWLLITSVLCFIIWFITCIINLYNKYAIRPSSAYYQRAKSFLKHIDIIHGGEHWISGLSSLVIFVVIGLTVWFAGDFLRLYPIETSRNMQASCDNSIRNAQFTSALQLPLPETDGSQWIIFDMLETQPFSMMIDVINTAAKCEDVQVQENKGSVVPPITLDKQNCSIIMNNTTVSFNFTIPAHQTTVQIDIIGPYLIGALRLCLHGPPNIIKKINILHELDVCFLFYTPNQTIGLWTEFNVRLVKVVNVTEPLNNNEETVYNGRWLPKITSSSLSDELVLRQYGEYMRYVTDRTSFIIQFSEESYFLQNNQKPVVRAPALIFHTLLFIFLIIEIFAVCFLLFKLCCIPIFRTGKAIFSSKRKKQQIPRVNREEFENQLSSTTANDKQFSFQTNQSLELRSIVDSSKTNKRKRLSLQTKLKYFKQTDQQSVQYQYKERF